MFLAPRVGSFAPPDTNVPPECPDTSERIWHGQPSLTGLKRRVRAAFCRFPDTGLFGLTPLRTHILICGYGRSGSTMLLAMMEHALPHARRFGREIRAWRAATYAWRNHSVVISKLPGDIFVLHRVRNFYEHRAVRLKVIFTLRDPRDLLTSRQIEVGPDSYHQDIRMWRLMHAYYRLYKDHADVLPVRYEDLVSDTDAVQARIDAFTGEPSRRPFTDFHLHASQPGFETVELNGVRPVDRTRVARWSRFEHRQRIQQVLALVPDFPQILIELGYETDTAWVQSWLASASSAPD